jgi:hypothetical protein
LVVLAVLYLVSVWLMSRGPAGVRGSFSYLAQLSFGVYLAHPLVLDLVLTLLRHAGLMAPRVWASVLTFGLTSALTIALCSALHRTRFSLALMGRQRLAPEQAQELPGWLRPHRIRVLAMLPAVMLAGGALVVLVLGGQPGPALHGGTPSWLRMVEASQPYPKPDQASAGSADDLFSCGGARSAPHSCPLDGPRPADLRSADPRPAG